MTDTTSDWQPIATAPRDREIRLRGHVFHDRESAIKLGMDKASKEYWFYAETHSESCGFVRHYSNGWLNATYWKDVENES